MTKQLPQALAFTALDAAAHKIAAFGSQREVTASARSGRLAKRAMSLVDHVSLRVSG